MAQNEEPNTKGDGGAKDDGDSLEAVETIANEVMRSGCGEILIVETRKSKKDEQLDKREPQLEERELQWLEKKIRGRKKKKDENGKRKERVRNKS